MRKNLFYAIAVVCAFLLAAPAVMAEQGQITKLRADRPAQQNQEQTPLPALIDTQHTMFGQTFITKSPLNFEVCYTNVSGVTMGDDETVSPQLRVLLFANGKSAGDYSFLLSAMPVLAAGATWCETFGTVMPKTTLKKIQIVLREPMRTQVRVKVNGSVDAGSESYQAFRIEQKDGSNNYWLIGNDEGHDINAADGFGSTTSPAVEIGPLDTKMGNEGLWTMNSPNQNGDAVGAYVESPPNAGTQFFVTGFDFSAADFFGGPATPASVGLYPNSVTVLGNRPNLASPLVAPVPVTPPAANSLTGGDHGNQLVFSPVAAPAGSPIWGIYFMGAGRTDFLGLDNPLGLDGGAGVADFDATFRSFNGFATIGGVSKFPAGDGGNWIMAIAVNDPAGAPFPTGGDNTAAFSSWKKAALTQMGE